jgi:hypothetical protein
VVEKGGPRFTKSGGAKVAKLVAEHYPDRSFALVKKR